MHSWLCVALLWWVRFDADDGRTAHRRIGIGKVVPGSPPWPTPSPLCKYILRATILSTTLQSVFGDWFRMNRWAASSVGLRKSAMIRAARTAHCSADAWLCSVEILKN